jgi:hypothetical protein
VNCGIATDTTIAVECTSGVDFVLIKIWRWHEFDMPVCSSCKARRRNIGAVLTILSIVAVFGLLFGMFALEKYFVGWGQRNLWLWLTIGSFFASVYLARNWVSPLSDAWLLGVRGVRLTKGGIGTLKFRDHEFATEAARLTHEA